jgi:hypothetical protein
MVRLREQDTSCSLFAFVCQLEIDNSLPRSLYLSGSSGSLEVPEVLPIAFSPSASWDELRGRRSQIRNAKSAASGNRICIATWT